MDHLSELMFADLLDGALAREERAAVMAHLASCLECWELYVLAHQLRWAPRRIELTRDPDVSHALAADTVSAPALASSDRSIIIRFRRLRPGGLLRAHLIADRDVLARDPKLMLSGQEIGFSFQSDGTVDLPGIAEGDITGATLVFPPELLSMDDIGDDVRLP